MQNEFDETPSVWVWPADAKEGWAIPDDFWQRVREGLLAVGIECETR